MAGDKMKDYALKTYSYQCSCGFTVKVFVDSGMPMEQYRCRSCGAQLKRTAAPSSH